MYDEKQEKIKIINMKNTLAIVAIGVIVIGIVLNENQKKVVLGEKPLFTSNTANGLDIFADIITLMIAIAAYLLVSYVYQKEENNQEGNLQILAAVLSIFLAILFLYLDEAYPSYKY